MHRTCAYIRIPGTRLAELTCWFEVENDFKEEDVGKTSAKIARAAGVKHEVAEAK